MAGYTGGKTVSVGSRRWRKFFLVSSVRTDTRDLVRSGTVPGWDRFELGRQGVKGGDGRGVVREGACRLRKLREIRDPIKESG